MARMDEHTLQEIFTYHKPGLEQLPKYEAVRNAGLCFAQVIIGNVPECADRTVALRKIREVVMDANAAIALNGLI